MKNHRHQAREAALQILYFWEVGKSEPGQALGAYFREHQPDAPEPVRTFATTLVTGTIAELPSLDGLIEQHSQHWRLERLAVIDRLILRVAVWELTHARETPPAVVLNEALELARTFSTGEAVKFVNGVLDAIRKTLEGRGDVQRS
jgi:transcription antitermination protein NusB